MNKKVIACILSAALLAAMTACGQPEAPAPTAGPAAAPSAVPAATPAPSPSPDAQSELTGLREQLEASGAIAAIVNLGYHDGPLLTDAFFERPEMAQYLTQYPFLAEIGPEACAAAEGGEIYCMIPADPACTVTVTEWDDLTAQAGAVLYQSKTGCPFYVQGNVSDIMPNLAITMQDSQGRSLTQYHPFASLKDGTIVLPAEGQPQVLDLTQYPAEDAG